MFTLRSVYLSVSVSLLIAAVSGAVSAAEEVPSLLKALAEAGPNGAGTRTASAAWTQLTQVDADQLPAVLRGLDDAGPLAANWISAAVDAIAERTLQKKQPLPARQLEKFVLDTGHAPRARRLAFEWLAREDGTAPDRLIPGMLHDPGVEFRRDAVARLLNEASRLLDQQRPGDAQRVYQKALSGARDLDQVKKIALQLKELGEPVDLVRHFGFLAAWKLIGPFDNTDQRGFNTPNPPEQEIDFAGVYTGKGDSVRWIDHTTNEEMGMVDLNAALGKANGVTAYAAAEFDSPGEIELELRLGCINAAKLWLNGKLLAAHEVYHSGTEMDQYVARGTMRAGRNIILLKVCQNEQKEDWAQDWEFQLRVCDATGTAVPSQPPAAGTR